MPLLMILSVILLSLSVDARQGAERGLSTKPGSEAEESKVEVAGALVGVSSDRAPKTLALEFPVERVTLDNGMVFLLHSQRSIPIVSFHTWFRVGAKDELPGESGLAHMFEHMMFKGTERYPNKEFDQILRANGIVNNAFTSQDYTGYYEILPSSKLELIMDIESDRLQSLKLLDEEFQKEREVVKEERRMRYDNEPGGKAWEVLTRLVFEGSQYALPVIGTMDEINAFDIEKLQRFYKKWYVPSNAVVVIVGDIDLGETKKLIQKYYGGLTSPPRPDRSVQSFPPLVGGRTEKVGFPVQSPEILMATRTVKGSSDEAFTLDLLASILGQGKSSRLHQELVYRQQVALSAGSRHYGMQDKGMLYVKAVAKPGVSVRTLKSKLEEEIQAFLTRPIRDEELVKAKNMVLSEYVESLKTTDGKARILALNEVLLGDYKEFFRDMDRYLKVTKDDLNRAKQFLAKNKLVHVIVDRKEGVKR